MRMYPLEVQQAFLLYSLLSDRWDGMSGMYMGKDMSSLELLLKIYEIEDKKTVVYFLKHIENTHSNSINEKQAEKQRARNRQSKIKK